MKLQRIIRAMVFPAVKFAVRNAFPVQEFIEAVKELYVDETAHQMVRSGHKANVTQIAIATGLHRRDVTRLFKRNSDSEREEEPVGVLMKVLAGWEQRREYQDKKGRPKSLTWKGSKSEFSKLVESVSTDISPKAVMSELKRLHLVKVDSGKVSLQGEAEMYTNSEADGLRQVALDIESLGLGAFENLYERTDPPHLHARTEYDNVFVDSVPAVKKWFTEIGTELHRRTRDFLTQHDKDLNPDPKREGGIRVVFGTFSHTSKAKSEIVG
ncbi:MAG: hypothetical protein KDD64_12230 [Bdellovibrionales bacterium]|nr:hypothetical protein [Bdellovibrionales bacterium]